MKYLGFSLVELDTQLEITMILEFWTIEELGNASQIMNEVFATITAIQAKT